MMRPEIMWLRKMKKSKETSSFNIQHSHSTLTQDSDVLDTGHPVGYGLLKYQWIQ